MKPTSILSVFPLFASLALSAPVAELSNKEVGIDSVPALPSSKEPAAFLSPGAQPRGQNAEKRAQLAKRAIVVDVYADSNFNGRHEGLTSDLNRCYNLGNGWNDVISSLRVPGGTSGCTFFVDAGCGGFGFGYLPGDRPTIVSSLNDRISSYRCT
ncbi:hypothetical protein B0O99DRAFT_640769 [Bisporella sp. PMI_857]|nr:hypothetical protein B0O99DRAFT_640769 [Bisporella sp. PMI_857]